jgi:hypothetical protein
MVLEDVEDPSCDGLMGLKKISTTSVLETGKISPLTVPDGSVVLSRPTPTLGCSTHDDDDIVRMYIYSELITRISSSCGFYYRNVAEFCSRNN